MAKRFTSARYWDGVAHEWDDRIFNVRENDQRGLLETEVTRSARGGCSAADFGCGVGGNIALLSKLFAHVCGLDQSTECVKIARDKWRGKNNVEIVCTDRAPKRYLGKFDCVLCVNVAIQSESRQWRRALREALKLAAPGGRLVLVVPSIESATLCIEATRAISRRSVAICIEPTKNSPETPYALNVAGVPTKHFGRTELMHELGCLGTRVLRIQRLEYSWHSHAIRPPKRLRALRPWDWLVTCTRIS